MTLQPLRLVEATVSPAVPPTYAGRLFLKVAEVAEILDADPRTVRRAIELEQIEAVRLGDNTIRVKAAPFWRLCGLGSHAPESAGDDPPP